MEINTRLQVEHPVTELVTGLDLVEWQLRVAAGEPLPLRAGRTSRSAATRSKCGCTPRIPRPASCPAPAASNACACRAVGAHVRIDSGVVEGDTVTIFYDPMIAKLIVHDADRPRALARLRDALAAVRDRRPEVEHRVPRATGAPSGGGRRHASIPATSTATSTSSLPRRSAGRPRCCWPPPPRAAAAGSRRPRRAPRRPTDPDFALGHRRRLAPGPCRQAPRWPSCTAASASTARAHGSGGDYRIEHGGASHARRRRAAGRRRAEPARSTASARRIRVRADARRRAACTTASAACACALAPMYRTPARRRRQRRRPRARADARPRRAGPGAARRHRASPGQEVLVMEAMKMELSLKAPRDGVRRRSARARPAISSTPTPCW